MTTVPPVAPAQVAAIGNNKAIAATLAGAASVIVVYIIDQFLKSPLPPEIVAAVQTLITGAAVYFVPHGSA